MRLFKANQPYLSEEDRARDARLTNIASRYRVHPSDDFKARAQPKAEPSAEDPELPL